MKHFPLVAAAFEGGIFVLAIALGWLLGIEPLKTFSFKAQDALLALVATAPPLALFWLSIKFPLGPLKEIVRLIDEMILPLFRQCRPAQLAVISAFAGLGEETLFRGVVQSGLCEWIGDPSGPWIGLSAAAVLFGLLHTITPAYAVLAGLIGIYLGGIWMATGNLLVPIVVHAVYDFLVLLYLIKSRPER
ncbi:MAG: CPBP family intramembrane metalloprotease [Pirellulales bacterium]|nr:CPBP family intramembrane metalloprotease [Pirellulales bacterium]